MSLSERLAAAAVERTAVDVRGTRTDEWADAELDDVEIGTALAVDTGLPAPCPDCGGPGYLDSIDLSSRRQHERCRSCGACWSRPV